MCSSSRVCALVVLASAGLAQAQPISFFSSDNATLYRGTNSGLDASFAGSDEIRGMSILENGASIGGASAGDVIGVSSPQTVHEDQAVYRIDNAFSGTPSLVNIGTIALADAVSDIAFANGKTYGVRNSGPAGTILIQEFDSSFAVVNTWDTGIALLDKGAGGLAYDNASGLFYVTDPDSDKLWSYPLGGSASLVGNVGFDYGNNDLAMFNGRLYAAIADLGTNNYNIGYFSTSDASFTNVVTVGSYLGGAIGAVVVPGAPSVVVLGVAGLAGLRRRRSAL